ncbi:MAG TPA: hypothetical protein VMW27_23845, partial [Thermoanaerobaculia bacterium]|nr:hypothetical protein [Thermoanaerobaculia bacterium]
VPANLWPPATYNAGYLYSDFVCGKIFLLKPVAGGGSYTSTEFATDLGGNSAVHMIFGPFGSGQALYYTTYAGGGQVRRISFVVPSAPQDFFTLTPCRVVDTRNPNGPLGGPALTGNVLRNFDVRGACGIPATVESLAVNVTLVNPTFSGFLRIYPAGNSAPVASILNFSAGQTRNNNAIVPLNNGSFSAAAAMQGPNSTAHLIVDVVGYFE